MSNYEQKDGASFWLATDRETGEPKLTRKGDKYWTGKVTLNGVTVNAAMFYIKQKDKRNPKGPDFTILTNEQNPVAPKAGTEREVPVDEIPF